jgi:hypothetical protein
MGSDGSIEKYDDSFRDVTQDGVDEAEASLQHIHRLVGSIEVAFLELGKALDQFETKKLYLGRGFTSFRQWADSDELSIGYNAAHSLIRVVREILPIFQKHNLMDYVPKFPISKMRALLPLMADPNGEDMLVQAVKDGADLTFLDTKALVQEMRGLDKGIDEPDPAIFKAKVTRGDEFHRLTVSCQDGVDYYFVGTLVIKPQHFARWEERFGRFIEIEG